MGPTEGGRVHGREFDYDPLVYDAMRDLANHLAGRYVHLAYQAGTDIERERWRRRALAVDREVEAVDPYDEAAVRAKAADLQARLRAGDADGTGPLMAGNAEQGTVPG